MRAIGFEGLKARGAAAVNAVAALLADPNPYMRGRALYLLYQLGPEGRQRAGTPESQKDPAMRIAAYRAMRRAGLDVLPVAARLAREPTPAFAARSRSRCATSRPPRRSTSSSRSRAASTGRIAAISKRSGTGATGRKPRSTIGCARELGRQGDPVAWSPAFAWIAWRLHVPAAVPDLLARARAAKLSLADRRCAIDALAFIDDPAASNAMLKLAGGTARCASWRRGGC